MALVPEICAYTLLGLILEIFESVGCILPSASRRYVAGFIGRLVAISNPSLRRQIEKNLKIINSPVTQDLHKSSMKVIENFAISLCDFIWPGEINIRINGMEHIQDTYKRGKGLVLITCHLGPWELGGHIFKNLDIPALAIYKRYSSALMRRFIQRHRAPGLNYVAVGEGISKKCMKQLRSGGALCALGDIPFGEVGVTVKLCGRNAKLPRGPVLLAYRAGSPVIPGFVLREGPGNYVINMENPIYPSTFQSRDIKRHGNEEVIELVQQVADVITRYVRNYPEQWCRFDNVWEDSFH